MTITIKNLSKGGNDVGVYIGRDMLGHPGSPLANPFRITSAACRLEVIGAYREWLKAKIAERDVVVCKELARLQSYAKAGDLTLLCWCAPMICHGDIIKEFLETQDFSEFL